MHPTVFTFLVVAFLCIYCTMTTYAILSTRSTFWRLTFFAAGITVGCYVLHLALASAPSFTR